MATYPEITMVTLRTEGIPNKRPLRQNLIVELEFKDGTRAEIIREYAGFVDGSIDHSVHPGGIEAAYLREVGKSELLCNKINEGKHE